MICDSIHMKSNAKLSFPKNLESMISSAAFVISVLRGKDVLSIIMVK